MYLSTALALVSSASIAASHPLLSARDIAAFPAGSSWDILLNKGDAVGNIKQAAEENFQVIDIDLFDTDKATIEELKANKQVICYFSAGSQEGWRPDAGDFKDGDTGKGLDGWPDEKWVNVKSENVKSIMKKRIQMAAQNGCTAIDPDNVDGFDGGQDGFGYDKSAYVDYVKFMAQEAKNNNLAIGLKNAVDLIPDVVSVVQFAVNEQCHEYSGECALYKPFTDANKAVFNIEYGGSACESPAGVKLSTLIKPEDQGLNTLGGACAGEEGTPAQPVPSPSKSVQPVPSKPASSQQPAVPSKTALPSQTVPIPSKTSIPTPTRSAAQPTPTDTEDTDDGDDNDDSDEEGEGDDGDDDDEPAPTSTRRPWGSYPTAKPKPWQYWGGHRTGSN